MAEAWRALADEQDWLDGEPKQNAADRLATPSRYKAIIPHSCIFLGTHGGRA